MSGNTPTFSYTCELCGLDGMSDDAMRTHTLARHVRGRPVCPFCDLTDVPSDEMLIHVNQAHLDYLTPEAELMAFIDDHSPGYDEDSKTLTDSYSFNTPNSIQNGWHSPDSSGTASTSQSSHHNGAISKNNINHLSAQVYHNGYRNGIEFGGTKSKKTTEKSKSKGGKSNKDYDFNGEVGANNINLNGSKIKSTRKKMKSRQNSMENETNSKNNRNENKYNHDSGNNSGSDYENSSVTKVTIASAGQGSPLRSQLALKLKANIPKILPSPTPTIQCLMCQFTSTCPQKLEEHINRAHFDLTSPSIMNSSGENGLPTNATIGLTEAQAIASGSQFQCPICEREFPAGSEVELHVNIEHRDILSPQKDGLDNASSIDSVDESMLVETTPSPCNMVCPVCCQTMPPLTTQQDLMQHIEEHFEKGANNDMNRVMSEEEREAQRHRERQEFQMLRAQYGMEEDTPDGSRGYSGQAARGLRHAVYAGQLSVADYYERRVGLRRAEAGGVDDGSSCTQGFLSKIAAVNAQNTSIARTYLCTAVDHYASTYGDRGWGCGYRNMQMLISSLLQHTGYNELLYEGAWGGDSSQGPPRTALPSISRLQLMVERAWQMGFDIQGSEQLGSRLYNTRKWIGACEVVTVLSSLRIRCQLVDFHRPTSLDGGHPELFNWVFRYFQENPDEFKPPLYLQHQGHSRTIIGYEKHRDGKSVLIVLDPSHAPAQVRQILHASSVAGASNPVAAAMRPLRRGSAALRAKQYQLVAVTGIMETEAEYEVAKVLQSIRIPEDR